MGWKLLSELTGTDSRACGKRSGFPDDVVVIATDRSGTNDAKKRSVVYALRLAIGYKLANELRLLPDDLIEVLFDVDERKGMIRRVKENGYKIRKATPKSETSKLTIKIKYRPNTPTVAKPVACPAEVTADGIVFLLPEECSFTENLREKTGK